MMLPLQSQGAHYSKRLIDKSKNTRDEGRYRRAYTEENGEKRPRDLSRSRVENKLFAAKHST